MAQVAFDTLSAAKRLEEDFEFSAKQAEGAAKLVYDHVVGNVATKGDLDQAVNALQKDMTALNDKIDTSVKALEEKMATLATKEEIANLATKAELAEVKVDIAEVRTEIAQSSNKTIYTLGGLIGVLFVIDRFLPLLGTG